MEILILFFVGLFAVALITNAQAKIDEENFNDYE